MTDRSQITVSEPVALSPCPFCKGGEFRFDESTHWTGRGSELLNVKLRHWCERRPNCPPSTIELVAKTEDEVRDLWNRCTHPPSERVRELTDEECDRIASLALDRVAAKEGQPWLGVNMSIMSNNMLRRELVRGGYAAIAAEGLKEGGP